MGACDGIIYSNTKFFENAMSWKGVLIEPDPTMFSQLKKNRPHSQCFHCAVSLLPGNVEFYATGPLSSVKDLTSSHHIESWHEKYPPKLIEVPSRRLDDILHEAGITHIDFWSLDVEGAEFNVLQTMDWSISVYLILIEKQEPESKKLCDEILLKNGFVRVENFAHNEIWINPKNNRIQKRIPRLPWFSERR
jgi:FkbM family methyltransferase